jgi:hypothetical protein
LEQRKNQKSLDGTSGVTIITSSER